MARKRSSRDRRQRPDEAEEELQGPPPREAIYLRSDAEREAEKDVANYTSTGPAMAGGDIDADWKRADSVGEEAVGGSVATPDQDEVDEMGDALGVPRAPDDEVRTSREILEERDRYRREEED